MTGFEIHDTLGEGLEPAFLNTDGTAVDTDKVTVTRDNSPISGVQLSYNSGTRTLTISNMKEGEGTGDITITYSTTIPNKYLLPESGSDTWGGSSKGGTVSNTAKLYASEDGTAIETPLAEATATHKVEPIQYLEKTGEKVNGNPRLLEWTVTVDRGIAKDADFTLTDTLPPSLTLVQTANDLPEGVSVPTGESYTPTLNSNPCTLEVEDNTFTLEIGGDSGNSFKDDGTATLVYYNTTVAESYFEDDDTPLGDNVASLSFDLGKPGESDPYTTQVSVPVGNGDGGVGVDTARVTKTAGDYDPTDRTVQWTVTINPNQADLKSASLTDNLSYMEITGPNGPISDNARSCGVEGHEKGAKLLADGTHKVAVAFEGDYNGTYEATEDNGSTGQSGITTWTITENTEGITGGDGNTNPSVPPLTLLQLKYDPKTSGENKVLTISVPENMEGNGKAVGKTSITVTFYTQFTDPCVYAGNGKATTAKNEISSWKITLGDSEGGSSEGSGEVSATVPLNTKMLEKQPPVYDYATNTFTWTVVVNEANLPLTGLTLTDELPNGLTYVKDSLKVNGSEPATGITAEQEGQTLTINLGDLSTEATLTFETTANPDALGFDGPNNVEIENTIEMRGKAYTDTDEFETVSSKTEETFANHGLVKNGELNKDDELIEHQVLINPFHVDLKGATLTDTLPDGLRLDPTTVKLYQAELEGTNKGDDKPKEVTQNGEATGWSFTNDPASNSFTVTLPTGDDSYVLVYAADVLDMPDTGKTQSYMNKIAFNGQMLGGPEENGVFVTGGGGGGGGGAAGSKKGSITLTKVDEEEKPLAGVTFSLYLWDENGNKRGLLLDQGVTDKDGKLTFTAIKLGRSYELVEEEFPDGYEKKYTVEVVAPEEYEPQTNSAGNLVITPTADEKEFEFTIINEKPQPGGDPDPGNPGGNPGGSTDPDNPGTTDPDDPTVDPDDPDNPDKPGGNTDKPGGNTDKPGGNTDKPATGGEDGEKLPQTGQLWWPVWALGLGGALLLMLGFCTRKRYRPRHGR